MYLCLSSGARPQYRRDIVRALALPSGTRLQFRYDLRWVAPAVREALSTFRAECPPVLVGYIDQSNAMGRPTIVPCRYGRIVDATAHGTTVSLQLELDAFAFAEDVSAANTELQSMAYSLPEPIAGEMKGFYWTKLGSTPTTIVGTTDLANWFSPGT